jgi:DNA-binding beta-propeller fold protein YncE
MSLIAGLRASARARSGVAACLIVGSVLVLGVFAPGASADLIVGSPGAGAGQYESPQGVAVDTSSAEPSSGDVYVADKGNNRIDVFSEAGTFLFAFGWGVRNGSAALQTCGPSAAPPSADCKKGIAGSGAGQFSAPEHIAVDNDPLSLSHHDVYVAERNTLRIQKFDPSGSFQLMLGGEVDKTTSANLCTAASLHTCGAGLPGSAAGQFGETSFVPIAVGPDGTLYVGDSASGSNRVQEFDPSGAFIKQLVVDGLGAERVEAIAVDSSGNFYIAHSGATGAVRKYDPAGALEEAWGESGKVNPSGNIVALALDPTGELFIADSGGVHAPQILRYDPTGAKDLVFFGGGTLQTRPVALAFRHSAGGDLFAAEAGEVSEPARVVQLALPPPGPLLVPGSAKASPVGSIRATLRVEFNPEGKAGKAKFQYITKRKYEEDGNSFGGGTVETSFSAPTPADFATHTVSATNVCDSAHPLELTCLTPETVYYFRAIASWVPPEVGTVTGEKAEFTTRPPVEIGASWSTEVGTGAATLHAEVNPFGVTASGRFEYVDDTHFKSEGGFASTHTETSTGVIHFGNGEKPVAGATLISGLQPATTYHYRLRAEDTFGATEGAESTLRTFTLPGPQPSCTNKQFRTGASAALPDCRAYELVSPLDKNNGDIITRINVTGYPTNLDQSAATVPGRGLGFTYSSYHAFADPKSAPYTSQYMATRHEVGEGEEGWQTESIDSLRSSPSFLESIELENEYKAFSADLSNGWLVQETEPTLAPCAPAGFADLYRRQSADGALATLSCVKPKLSSKVYLPELEGSSADGSSAVFRVDDALTADASSATTGTGAETRPIYQTYESSGAGQLHLISVLPSGLPSGVDSSAGTAFSTTIPNHNREQIVAESVSSDGQRVFWSTAGAGPIYLRENATSEQSLDGSCDEPGRACTIAASEGKPAYFQAATPEGNKVLYKVSAGPSQGDLDEYDIGAETVNLIAKGVQGNILGASANLSRVYFASTKASAQAKLEGAIEGEPNVYLAEAGASRFVGTLSSTGSEPDTENQFGSPIATKPISHTARVSANGASLVFMSNSPGLAKESSAEYDNTNASSPAPCGAKDEAGEEGICDAEVYLYDAEADGGEGKLRCVSCEPSGARPDGREIEQGSNNKRGLFAAATIPRPQSQLYQARYLSDAGNRVFFDSFDALVLGDTNGKEDIYEWEEAGTGKCTTESSSFVAASEGCLGLISSGRSTADSEFLDASSDGHDAFFTTAEGLLPQDFGLIDAYDAREGGGFPAPPNPTKPCEGEACQSPPEAPNDPTPGSSTFEGAGSAIKKPPQKKRHHKQKKRHHNKHRRTAR